MCSSTRGPAIDPCLVTWPIRNVVVGSVLVTSNSAAVDSLTWATDPGADVRSGR